MGCCEQLGLLYSNDSKRAEYTITVLLWLGFPFFSAKVKKQALRWTSALVQGRGKMAEMI